MQHILIIISMCLALVVFGAVIGRWHTEYNMAQFETYSLCSAIPDAPEYSACVISSDARIREILDQLTAINSE